MSENKNFEHIPQEKFAFVQKDARIHDKKLDTKARSYFADAILRFRKNKSSVVAAWILLFLVLYSVVAPLLSPYDLDDKDDNYSSSPAYVPAIAQLNLGILDGARTHSSQNDAAMNFWKGIAKETGRDPVLKVLDTKVTQVKYRGKMVDRFTYTIETNRYFEIGIVYRTLRYDEYEALQQWQNETGIQVIYPYVEPKDINGIENNPNLWYKVDSKGQADLDADGNFVPVYSTRTEIQGPIAYNSIRIEGDPGTYIYAMEKSNSVQCRIDYYSYYQYKNGHEPSYILGTNVMGQDLFTAIAIGARFSIIFAIIISAINLTIGAFYGATQGYYGGWVDMLMDRIADILYDVPFVVVVTLFQFHVAPKLGKWGVVVAFLLAFVMTGWIGMAALTRKQFYRFKSQEFVLAARTLGASDGRLMFKHIFPNGLGTIITSCALVIPSTISSETNMTYLGIVNLSEVAGTSLGTLLSQGQANMTTAPHAMLWPSIYFALLMISFNLFGNGLRDAFNPSTRGAED